MCGNKTPKVVVESCADGPAPLTPAAMSTVPANTAAASHNNSAAVQRRRIVHALQEGVQRDLADDVTAVAALIVDVVRIPFAEDVIGPPVDGMAMIVSAHVQGELVQQIRDRTAPRPASRGPYLSKSPKP